MLKNYDLNQSELVHNNHSFRGSLLLLFHLLSVLFLLNRKEPQQPLLIVSKWVIFPFPTNLCVLFQSWSLVSCLALYALDVDVVRDAGDLLLNGDGLGESDLLDDLPALGELALGIFVVRSSLVHALVVLQRQLILAQGAVSCSATIIGLKEQKERKVMLSYEN